MQMEMEPYEIVKLGIVDHPACMALFGGRCPFAENCLAQRQTGNREAYLLRVNGEIVSECHLVYDTPEYGTVPGRRLYFSRMITKKEYRRQGYGEKMARFILALAKEKGYSEIALGVNCDNDAALALYKKLGFSVYEKAEDDYGEYYRMEITL